MSANHDIYIKHNLTDDDIRNIDKIIIKYLSQSSEDYFEYLTEYYQLTERYHSKIENRQERIITVDDIKQILKYKEIDKVYARVEPSTLTDEELYDDSINLYGYDFHNWIVESLNAGRFIGVNMGSFGIILSSTKTVIEVECYTKSVGLYHINKEYKKYNAMRKFVYGLVKVFDSSKDYKAIYINDEGIEQKVFNDIIEGFDYKSFQELYNDSLKYDYIDAVNPPTEEEWIESGKGKDEDGYISLCPIVIDDFRDFKQLENT